MSTRRTRQELIEQGVLKEVPDNGKSVCVIHLISLHNGCLHPTAAALRLSRPRRQYSELISTLCQEHCPPIQQVSETYFKKANLLSPCCFFQVM